MSKILIVSGFKNAQELLTEAQIRYIKQDDTIGVVDASDKSNLDTAIAELDEDQDVIYVLGNISDTGIITSTQETALEAKLVAETGELVNYTSTDQSAAVDMAFQAWRDLFGTDTTPSPAIIYTAELTANLTETEQAQGAYLGYSIVARYYGNLGTDETLYELWSLLDRGLVPDSSFRPAVESKLAYVNYSALLLTDLLNEGLAISNYMTAISGATPTVDYYGLTVGSTVWEGTINYETKAIAVAVPFGTTLTALIATFDLSETASAFVSDVEQTSGTTPNDFSSAVDYNIVGDSGEIETFTVTVSSDGGSSENDFLTFSFPEQTEPATIDATAHTVAITVAFGTDETKLIPTFTVSDNVYSVKIGETDQVSGVTENTYAAPVTYAIVAENGDSQDWQITVSIAGA